MRYLVAILSAILFSTAQAQPWEIGGWVGAANYFGDLNTTRSFRYLRPAAGLTARHNFSYYLSVRPFINVAQLEATDIGAKNPWENARRLDFKTNIYEAGAQFEFNFFKYYPGHKDYYFAPYTFAGIGLFYFSPKGTYEGFPDQSLDFYGTEGQGLQGYEGKSKYGLIQPSIPYGVGFKYGINYFWNFAFEIGQRRTYTDYLDDVSTTYADNNDLLSERGEVAAGLADKSGTSVIEPIGRKGKQRGDSQNNDAYMFIGVYLTYTIRSVRCAPPKF